MTVIPSFSRRLRYATRLSLPILNGVAPICARPAYYPKPLGDPVRLSCSPVAWTISEFGSGVLMTSSGQMDKLFLSFQSSRLTLNTHRAARKELAQLTQNLILWGSWIWTQTVAVVNSFGFDGTNPQGTPWVTLPFWKLQCFLRKLRPLVISSTGFKSVISLKFSGILVTLGNSWIILDNARFIWDEWILKNTVKICKEYYVYAHWCILYVYRIL